MRAITILLATAVALVGAPFADAAAKSCSSFAVITGFDADGKTVTLEKAKSTESKFFPKPEGAPKVSKIPKKCSSKILGQDNFAVTLTGGKMTVTQVRQNFSNKMLNDTDDASWLGKKLEELIAAKATVLVVARPPLRDKKGAYGLTTVYLPATQEDLDEIKRLEAMANDE
jgi:hypothetical protein